MSNKIKLGKNPLDKKITVKSMPDFPHTTLFKEVVKPLSSLEKLRELEIKVDWSELADEVLGKKISNKLRGLTKILGLSILVACIGACNSGQRSKEEAELKRQLIDIQKLQAKQANQMEELNNKLLLLGEKMDAKPAVLPPVKESISETKGGDVKLYERAMKDLKNNSFESFRKNTELLNKGFKDSPLANNAMYLLGDTYFRKADYGNAAKTFEQLYSTNPDGNRAVSTLYLLGLSYQKLGRTQEAKEAFQSIVNIYPGSREAAASSKKLALMQRHRQ